MKVIILAAGYATRLHPLTLDKPKPLLEVAGKPIVVHIIDNLEGITDIDTIYIVTNDKFEKHFLEWKETFDTEKTIEIINDPDVKFEVQQESTTSIGNQNVVDDDFDQLKRLQFIGILAGSTFEPLIDSETSSDYVVPASTDARIAIILHNLPNNATGDASFGFADDAIGTNFVTLLPSSIYSPKGDDVLTFTLLFVVPTGKFIGQLNTSGGASENNVVCEIREVPT